MNVPHSSNILPPEERPAATRRHGVGPALTASPPPSGRTLRLVSWTFQIAVAAILLQTLFFKFTAAEESVYIFETLGLEPLGRIASGVAELIAALLLLVPATAWMGALLSLGVISGAVVSHLTILGIEVKGDGGLLFALSILVLVASASILLIRRRELPWRK